MYDNSKEALAAIMREQGVEVLLGSRLKNFLKDYAPNLKGAWKNGISLVYDSGAADILKGKLSSGAEEQQVAFIRAVQKMVDEYPVERSYAESIIWEVTAALGWKVSAPEKPQTAPAPDPQSQPAPGPVQVTGSLTAGQRNVQFGPCLWRVLDVQGGRALLLTEKIPEKRPYHSSITAVTWEECALRKYLNGAFLQKFSSQEQSRIVPTVNTNPDNSWYGTAGGRNTTDKVFLLSIEEVVKYFGDSGQLWEVIKGRGYIYDEYKSARIAKYQGEEVWWWLRSPGDSDGYAFGAAYVGRDGTLFVRGTNVDSADGGVRPALWINL